MFQLFIGCKTVKIGFLFGVEELIIVIHIVYAIVMIVVVVLLVAVAARSLHSSLKKARNCTMSVDIDVSAASSSHGSLPGLSSPRSLSFTCILLAKSTAVFVQNVLANGGRSHPRIEPYTSKQDMHSYTSFTRYVPRWATMSETAVHVPASYLR